MASEHVGDDEGVLRETQATPPAHYLFKLESFSLFSENFAQIKSKTFQAGGHRWKILLFPTGKGRGTGDYLSVYLKLESISSLIGHKDVNAIFKFFLYDQIRGKYLTVQGSARRFDIVKQEWGVAKFMSLKTLKEPSNGFLVDDTSIFGAEVFVTEGLCLSEWLSISKVANISNKYQWTVNQFSELGERASSDQFVAGGHKWRIQLYPEGNLEYKGVYLSLYLEPVACESFSNVQEVKAQFTLTLKDQLNQNDIKRTTIYWFNHATTFYWGWHSFIQLKDLNDSEKGYLVADRCMFEAEVTVLCKTTQKYLDI